MWTKLPLTYLPTYLYIKGNLYIWPRTPYYLDQIPVFVFSLGMPRHAVADEASWIRTGVCVGDAISRKLHRRFWWLFAQSYIFMRLKYVQDQYLSSYLSNASLNFVDFGIEASLTAFFDEIDICSLLKSGPAFFGPSSKRFIEFCWLLL